MNQPRIHMLEDFKIRLNTIKSVAMDEKQQEYDPEGRSPFIRLCDEFINLIDAFLKNEI